MSNTWFTADLHLDHEAIIDSCERPFMNKDKMNNTLIRNINKCVKPEDVLYILGDLTMHGPTKKDRIEQFINQINGTKILILGNHDRLKAMDYVDLGFQSVHTSLHLVEQDLYLIHDPSSVIIIRDKTWLCGHLHTFFKQHKNAINVGVDVWNYKPVSLEEINKIRPY